jgi:hypothetical protein
MKLTYLSCVLLWLGCSALFTTTNAPRHENPAGQLLLLPPMKEPRASHTATLLPNGEVLLAGGFHKGLDGASQLYSSTTERYDPKARVFRAAASLSEARCGHSATLLPNGKVLIAGGFNQRGILSSAELYDPSSDSFSAAGHTTVARGSFTATLLTDGRVLFVGGGARTPINDAEIYDPATNQFTKTGSLLRARLGHTATLLQDGRVLILGGLVGRDDVTRSAEIFDPIRGGFTSAGEINMPRYKHATILLEDGRVLVVGGADARDWRGQHMSAEIFDARTNSSSRVSDLNAKRFKLPDALATLTGGRILIGGGSEQIELFEPKTSTFSSVGELESALYNGVVTALPEGALITGGYDERLRASHQAWFFQE